jgi:hypothetical protein
LDNRRTIAGAILLDRNSDQSISILLDWTANLLWIEWMGDSRRNPSDEEIVSSEWPKYETMKILNALGVTPNRMEFSMDQ